MAGVGALSVAVVANLVVTTADSMWVRVLVPANTPSPGGVTLQVASMTVAARSVTGGLTTSQVNQEGMRMLGPWANTARPLQPAAAVGVVGLLASGMTQDTVTLATR